MKLIGLALIVGLLPGAFLPAWAGEDPAEFYQNGNRLFREQKYDEAIGQYQKVIELKPDYSEAHYNLGVAYQKKGMLAEATAAYQQALLFLPIFHQAHYNLGTIYARNGMPDKAIEAYLKAIEDYPDYADANYNLACLYAEQQRYYEAWQYFNKAQELGIPGISGVVGEMMKKAQEQKKGDAK